MIFLILSILTIFALQRAWRWQFIFKLAPTEENEVTRARWTLVAGVHVLALGIAVASAYWQV